MICDPVLTEVARNPFSDSWERWVGPKRSVIKFQFEEVWWSVRLPDSKSG